MTNFDDRDQAFENKFMHDQELQFKVLARRNKLLGLWAAEQLGKEGDEANIYAKEVVAADFDEPGQEDVFRKVNDDLREAGLPTTNEEIRYQMERLLGEAKKQLMSEIA